MWNKSGLHSNEYNSTCLVNNFWVSMNAWRYEICPSAHDTSAKEDSSVEKKVNNVRVTSF